MSVKQWENNIARADEMKEALRSIKTNDESALRKFSERIPELKQTLENSIRIFEIITRYANSSNSPKQDICDQILAFEADKYIMLNKLKESEEKIEEQVREILALDIELHKLNQIIIQKNKKMAIDSAEIKNLIEENQTSKLQYNLSLNNKNRVRIFSPAPRAIDNEKLKQKPIIKVTTKPSNLEDNVQNKKNVVATKILQSAAHLKSSKEWLAITDDSDDSLWICILPNGKVRGINPSEIEITSVCMLPISSDSFSIQQRNGLEAIFKSI